MKNTIRLTFKTSLALLCFFIATQTAQAQSGKTDNTFKVSIDASDSINPIVLWTTQKEVNTSHFIIKYGVDSSNLEYNKMIKAGGSTMRSSDYNFDQIIYSGKPIYVQIVLVTIEGNRKKSTIIYKPLVDSSIQNAYAKTK